MMNFIRSLPFMDKDLKKKQVYDLEKGQKWEDVKIFDTQKGDSVLSSAKDSSMSSIFKHIDNGNGIIETHEINNLNNLLRYIDSLGVGLNKNNKIIDQQELLEFQKKIDNKEISYDALKNIQSEHKNYAAESADRHIKSINIKMQPKFQSSIMNNNLYSELGDIAKEQGFEINQMDYHSVWLEDHYIKRPDGNIYVPPKDYASDGDEVIGKDFVNENNIKSLSNSSSVYHSMEEIPEEFRGKVHYGTSYLEGGNVLVVNNKHNKPAAIVGDTSIGLTLDILKLEHTPENIDKAKKYISEDLGIPEKDITFIPQYDFHIDMLYRPLKKGEMLVPDIEGAIKFLENNEVTGMNDQQKQERIQKLQQLALDTKDIRADAENKLKKAGYKLCKMPCFSTDKKDPVNFMNAVAGTSEKTGQEFYITNKCDYPEIQEYVSSQLNKHGVDKTYFVSTQNALKFNGGIDCLTQENLDI